MREHGAMGKEVEDEKPSFYGIPLTEKQVKQFRLDDTVELKIVGTIESLHSGDSRTSKDTMTVVASSVVVTKAGGNEFEDLAESE